MEQRDGLSPTILLDEERLEVILDGAAIPLSWTEFAVLRVLSQSPGRVFSRVEILDAIHGTNYSITPKAVDVQICALRRKLGVHGRMIVALRKLGYRFRASD